MYSNTNTLVFILKVFKYFTKYSIRYLWYFYTDTEYEYTISGPCEGENPIRSVGGPCRKTVWDNHVRSMGGPCQLSHEGNCVGEPYQVHWWAVGGSWIAHMKAVGRGLNTLNVTRWHDTIWLGGGIIGVNIGGEYVYIISNWFPLLYCLNYAGNIMWFTWNRLMIINISVTNLLIISKYKIQYCSYLIKFN